eukprot:TRINITY_DN213_c3_g1_i1.p1 TRINITY_DN213_c3_g1~~TRINITY_DN213_c3_g1_i1.p1  ORF type:complete len:364 (-),score=86.20 TRINITY_DN213_c3_g1_i1:103-1194(-)
MASAPGGRVVIKFRQSGSGWAPVKTADKGPSGIVKPLPKIPPPASKPRPPTTPAAPPKAKATTVTNGTPPASRADTDSNKQCRCGAALAADAAFCSKCGSKVQTGRSVLSAVPKSNASNTPGRKVLVASGNGQFAKKKRVSAEEEEKWNKEADDEASAQKVKKKKKAEEEEEWWDGDNEEEKPPKKKTKKAAVEEEEEVDEVTIAKREVQKSKKRKARMTPFIKLKHPNAPKPTLGDISYSGVVKWEDYDTGDLLIDCPPIKSICRCPVRLAYDDNTMGAKLGSVLCFKAALGEDDTPYASNIILNGVEEVGSGDIADEPTTESEAEEETPARNDKGKGKGKGKRRDGNQFSQGPLLRGHMKN